MTVRFHPHEQVLDVGVRQVEYVERSKTLNVYVRSVSQDGDTLNVLLGIRPGKVQGVRARPDYFSGGWVTVSWQGLPDPSIVRYEISLKTGLRDWSAPVQLGIRFRHRFHLQPGTWQVRIRAVNIYRESGDWSEPATVTPDTRTTRPDTTWGVLPSPDTEPLGWLIPETGWGRLGWDMALRRLESHAAPDLTWEATLPPPQASWGLLGRQRAFSLDYRAQYSPSEDAWGRFDAMPGTLAYDKAGHVVRRGDWGLLGVEPDDDLWWSVHREPLDGGIWGRMRIDTVSVPLGYQRRTDVRGWGRLALEPLEVANRFPLGEGEAVQTVFTGDDEEPAVLPEAGDTPSPVPPTPGGLSLATAGRRRIRATWTALDVGYPIVYELRRRQVVDGRPGGPTSFSGGTGTSFTIGSLLDNRVYEVGIRAGSSAGWSEWSQYVRIRTPRIPLPRPPTPAFDGTANGSFVIPAPPSSKVLEVELIVEWITQSGVRRRTVRGITRSTADDLGFRTYQNVDIWNQLGTVVIRARMHYAYTSNIYDDEGEPLFDPDYENQRTGAWTRWYVNPLLPVRPG